MVEAIGAQMMSVRAFKVWTKTLKALSLAALLGFSFTCLAAGSAASGEKNTKIAIIGNSELPAVSASLAWRVAEGGSKGGEVSKPVDMPSVGTPIDIIVHKRQVYFEKHLEIDVNHFNKR